MLISDGKELDFASSFLSQRRSTDLSRLVNHGLIVSGKTYALKGFIFDSLKIQMQSLSMYLDVWIQQKKQGVSRAIEAIPNAVVTAGTNRTAPSARYSKSR
ncbi:uncharacterized protein LOC142162896 [Nicotiana tabacum]|uniref:Uncharacterized protein LOC142162896 n=1 Tax=Nicotiana tabacum TaxID=4097 RepID=A0AC58RTK4_TOBAC